MAKPWYEEESAQAPKQPTPWYEEPTSQPPMEWLDVAHGAVKNFPSSAYKIGEGVVEAVANPVDTAEAIYGVGKGALQLAFPNIAEVIGKDEQSIQLAQAVGQLYVDRYGSVEGFKKTLATDPAGVLAEIAPIVGQAGKMLNTASKATGLSKVPLIGAAAETVGNVAQTAGYLDPFKAVTSGTAGALNVAGGIGGDIAQRLSGVTPDAITEAFMAGKKGGERQASFKEGMNSDVSRKIVEQSRAALKAMQKQASDMYDASMKVIRADKTNLPMDGILDALAEIKKMTVTPAGRQRSAELNTLYQKLQMMVNDVTFKGDYTPIELDLLKQDIGDLIYDATGKPALANKTANAMATKLMNSVKDTLVDYNPEYASIMSEYGSTMRTLNEIKAGLSLGDRTSVETAARKLYSSMRNNVNTNFGARKGYMDELSKYGAENVPALIAGSEMSAPRGIQGAVSPFGAGVAGSVDPTMGAGYLAASSPRVIGKTANIAGQTARILDAFGLPSTALGIVKDNPNALNLLWQQQRAQEELEKQKRGQ
jgi:hypothetical protein